jgi:hypothetical protein
MDRLTEALARARRPSKREFAALYVVSGLGFVFYGLIRLALPGDSIGHILLSTACLCVGFWLGADPRLRRWWVARSEGRRPVTGLQKADVAMWRQLLSGGSVIACTFEDWLVMACGLIGVTIASRAPYCALFVLGLHYLRVPTKFEALVIATGLAFATDGLVQWLRGKEPGSLQPNNDLESDLLALIKETGPVDGRWLELSSGLAPAGAIRSQLDALRARSELRHLPDDRWEATPLA